MMATTSEPGIVALRRRRARQLICALAVLIVVAVPVGVWSLDVMRSRAAAVERWGSDECRQALSFLDPVDQIQLPLAYYGKPSSCMLRRSEGHVFGRFTGSGYYVVATDRGLFVSRIDYTDPGVRFATGQTFEIAPHDVPAGVLSASESSRYLADVADRGGTRSRPWSWGGYDG